MLPHLISCQSYIEHSKFVAFLDQCNANDERGQQFFAGYKNSEFIIQGGTHSAAQGFGLKNAEQLYGLTDYDISCPASVDLIHQYIAQDQKVLEGNKLIITDLLTLNTGNILTTTIRIPVINDKFEIIGTAFFAYQVLHNPLLNALSHHILHKDGKCGISLILNEENILIKNIDKKLSKKEFEILWLLTRGLSPKKIAEFLCRSTRTIEEHIDNIKIKYNCSYKAQLIEQAVNDGVLNHLPMRLAMKKQTLSIFNQD